MRRGRRAPRLSPGVALPLAVAAALALVGCGVRSPSPTPGAGAGTPVTVTSASRSGPSAYTKVMVIAEENETYRQVLGGSSAPYLTSLARQFGTATAMDAGYPPSCPSLAAYLIMTSGDRHGVCDDDAPAAHRLGADNIFRQVAASGRQWRGYAESMPGSCTTTDQGSYAVRHAPAAYYVSELGRCAQWLVPLGTISAGALHDDVVAGSLPAYSFVTPNLCDDMHGGDGCSGDQVAAGDRWLNQWVPAIMTGPDYAAGRLVVLVVWDEGTSSSNHVPALVLSPTTRQVTVTRPIDQCNLLRTVQDVLRLAPLGCAQRASSVAADFHL